MKTKICGIYSIYCLGNSKRYVGISNDIENRWVDHKSKLRAGRHSNTHLQSAWKKYGESAFEFMVLQESEELLLGMLEVAWIRHYDAMNTKVGFNMNEGGKHGKHCDEARAKISAAGMGRSPSEETRAKLREAKKGKKRGPLSDAHRSKLSLIRRGRIVSEETRAKISASKKGIKFSDEHRANISVGRQGRVITAETRAKNGASHRGRVLTSEHRAKISSARKGRPLSVAHRSKLSAANKGKTLTAEHRAKLCAAWMVRKAQRKED